MANSRICSIPNCGNPVRARGWCNAHWTRWKRKGDPLAGQPPRGEAQTYYREVVLPYEGKECLPWPYGRYSNGYGRVTINGKRGTVSRMVCEETHGAPPHPSYEAAHICGKGHLGCVNPNHLIWKTKAENLADKLAHGTHNRGEQNPTSVVTEAQARAVKAMKGSGLSTREIGNACGVAEHNAYHILHGSSWAWL